MIDICQVQGAYKKWAIEEVRNYGCAQRFYRLYHMSLMGLLRGDRQLGKSDFGLPHAGITSHGTISDVSFVI